MGYPSRSKVSRQGDAAEQATGKHSRSVDQKELWARWASTPGHRSLGESSLWKIYKAQVGTFILRIPGLSDGPPVSAGTLIKWTSDMDEGIISIKLGSHVNPLDNFLFIQQMEDYIV